MINNIVLGFLFTTAIVSIITLATIGWVEYKEWKDKKKL